MASKAQIDPLAQRIEALARPSRLDHRVAMVIVDGESQEAARERHCKAHPEAREASGMIFMHIIDPRVPRGLK
jgi:hypothetical protein